MDKLPELIDLWVGVVCESNHFKRIQAQVETELPKGSVHLVHIQSVGDTFVTKFAFVVDLVKNGTSEYDKIMQQLKYRTIPVIQQPDVLKFIVNLII